MADELHQEDSPADLTTGKFRSPFPYFGGKSRAASLIWSRLGDVPRYIEPFAGSLATLLARPTPPQFEVINDLDCMISNFWRSLTFAPETLADYADGPVNEADLHARHLWLVSQEAFRERMKVDPDFYDPKIAGWWLYGVCAWLAGGWCHDEAISQKTGLMGRSIPCMVNRGIETNRILNAPDGIHGEMLRLANRLRRTKVTCGDWARVLSPAVIGPGVVGFVLDPPYFDGLSDGLYSHSDANVSGRVRQWAIENGENLNYRICLCGYEDEHPMPASWEKVAWKAVGGYGNHRKDGTNKNMEKERLWFSPGCIKVTEDLFYQPFEDEEDE